MERYSRFFLAYLSYFLSYIPWQLLLFFRCVSGIFVTIVCAITDLEHTLSYHSMLYGYKEFFHYARFTKRSARTALFPPSAIV